DQASELQKESAIGRDCVREATEVRALEREGETRRALDRMRTSLTGKSYRRSPEAPARGTWQIRHHEEAVLRPTRRNRPCYSRTYTSARSVGRARSGLQSRPSNER